MEWYQVVSFIVGFTGIGSVIGGLILSLINKKKSQLSRGQQEEADDHTREMIKSELAPIVSELKVNNDLIRNEIKTLNEKVEALDVKLDPICDGTMSTLRDSILSCYYKCSEKGYRNDYDYENIHHMFDAYHELKGNSFVEDVMNRFDRLPVKEETVPTKVVQRKYSKNNDIID